MYVHRQEPGHQIEINPLNNTIMKSIFRIWAIVSSLVMIFACNNEVEDPDVVVKTAEVTEVTANSAVSGGEVIYEGTSRITAYGVCWSQKTDPTIADEKTEDGDGVGEFVSEITGLEPGCTYYVRAYAVSSKGVAYGEQKQFSTGVVVPTVTTAAMSNVTFENAVTGGTVTFNGGAEITAVGVCWGTTENPDLDGLHTEDELGADNTWESVVEGLEPDCTYYVRAYAINEAGVAYGNQITFGTSTEPVVEAVADAALWSYILTNYDLNNDAKIQLSEAELVTVIDCPAAGVTTIEGLTQFENLRDLRLNSNALTAVDLTGLANLEIFWGFDNPNLATVNISGLSNLRYLHCQNTPITALDLSAAANMVELNLYNTQLEAIDLTYCNPLTILNLENSKVTSVDISNKTALWYCNVRLNQNITALNVQGCSALRELYVDNTCISNVDASNLESLEVIWAFNMRVENVDLKADNCPNLKYLHGYNEDLGARPNGHFINCSAKNCPNLTEYRCFNNPNIKEVDFTGSFTTTTAGHVEINLDQARLTKFVLPSEPCALTYINIHWNQLESLDLTNAPNLIYLHSALSNLRTITVRGCSKLTEAYVNQNPNLTGLDFTGCDALRVLWAFENPSMTTLNVAPCKNLYYMDAHLTGVNHHMEFADMPALWQTILWSSQVPSATYSNVPELDHMNYENAPLATITIANAPKLEYPIFVNTQLKTLDMTGAPNVCRLAVRNSKPLESVTLTSNPKLHSFWGWDTSMTTLDLRGCADAMDQVMVDANPLLKTIYVRANQTFNFFNKDADVEVIQ